jgi:hypothetical protein
MRECTVKVSTTAGARQEQLGRMGGVRIDSQLLCANAYRRDPALAARS